MLAGEAGGFRDDKLTWHDGRAFLLGSGVGGEVPGAHGVRCMEGSIELFSRPASNWLNEFARRPALESLVGN
jgi:hypothetical protein